MRFIQHSIAWFASVLIVGVTGQASFAFTIIPSSPGATDNWKPTTSYNADGVFGITEVDRRLWTEPLRLGGSTTFNITLALWVLQSNQGLLGWDFKPADQDLKGSFEIKDYVACGYGDLCGLELPIDPDEELRDDGVGASFHLKYLPAPGDPQLGQGKVHWIQAFRANYSDRVGLFPNIWYIDNDFRRDTPFADEVNYYVSESSFIDIPYNPGLQAAQNKNYFEALLFLAEEITSPNSSRREVKIYNGIKWGWKNYRDEYEIQKTFADSLYSSGETDTFQLTKLTPGAKFHAEINNDIPGNICNPNTYLEARHNYETWGYDNDSSPVGDGFASALTGNVSSDGTINLTVGAYGDGGNHIRGKDGGKYELTVQVFEHENDFPYVIGANSGGGGVSRERPGGTQDNPILPNARDGNWQVFRNVPGCRWYDPYTTYGFEFQALDDTLFTEILDFPIGDDNRFTVSVGDTILGEFSPGESLDFVSLFGHGISNFKITDIDSLFGSTQETAFPIQLAFNDRIGSFKMRPISKESSPQSVPESTPIFGLLTLGAWGFIKALKIRSNKQQ
ncbi:hypothetical protein [Chlorogloeopsis sp. ULAP02]|uniref:hypothetical protein n=1 Tax=Chlorogloeopsis sp. ULAP02 TaxID=3107926 RepID=UPI003135691E